jgi:ketosteroid isomerase-like protein
VIEGKSDIKEVRVEGDMACMWSHLTVVVTPPGAPAIRRAGHTLTVLRRVSGRWLLARDANLLVKLQEAVT